MMLKLTIPVMFVAVLALAAPLHAQSRGDSLGADWREQQAEARAKVREGRHVSLDRVIDTIRRRTPGQLLDAGLEDDGGRPVYRVRWAAPNGRRIDFIVDAETGQILSGG